MQLLSKNLLMVLVLIGLVIPGNRSANAADSTSSVNPIVISALSTSSVPIATGGGTTCAITPGGGVKCWGDNSGGEIGDGHITTTPYPRPTPVIGLSSGVVSLIGGIEHICALLSTGGVKCWGRPTQSASPQVYPTDVSGLTSGVAAFSAGSWRTCVLTTGGGVKCWGYNNYGQLGNGSTLASDVPVNVTGLSNDVSALASGAYHNCVIMNNGGVKCWGYNYQGILGDSTTTNRSTPVDVVGLTGGASAISLGALQTCIVNPTGGVKCWGGSNGITPVDISGLSSGVAELALGQTHACALTSTGGVKCWGNNNRGQLGDNSTITRNTPEYVTGLSSGVSAISSGVDFSCVMMIAGGAKCWGYNAYGQLGDGTTTNRLTPVDVVDLATYSISGKVTTSTGVVIPGATISADGGKTTTTDGSGNYSLTGLAPGSYVLTPSKPGYSFTPSTLSIILTNTDLSNQNFTGAKYPIILLPGIMGSRLTNSPNSGPACDARPSGEIWVQQLISISTLMLTTDSSGNLFPQNSCDHISATGIMDSGLATDFYGHMVTALNSDGYPTYTFPYDWRLSLEYNAAQLDNRVEEIRNATGEDKVILLGHSMGGLLARQYISNTYWAPKVDKVISVGSPYWGAPKLANAMREGKTGIGFADKLTWLIGETIKDLIRNSPGSMELLPSQAFVQQYAPYYWDRSGPLDYDQTMQYFASHGQNVKLLQQAQDFHAELDDFRSANLNGTSYFVLTANQLPTSGEIIEIPCTFGGTCFYTPKYALGDGTVPWISARLRGIAGDWKGNAQVCTMQNVSSDHSGLMSDTIVLGLVEKILDNQSFGANDCLETQTDPAGTLSAAAAGSASTAFIEVVVQGSSRVTVEDAAQHIATVGDDGVITNEIPSATFEMLNQTTTLTLPTASTYTLTLQQTGSTPEEVRVTDFRTLSNPEAFAPYQRAVFVDVPSTAGGIATLAIDYTTGMSSLQLLLDKDGNGSSDQTLPPTHILDQTQSLDYFPPVTAILVSGSKDSLGFYTGPVTATLSAIDQGVGVLKTEYSLDGGLTWLPYSAPVQFAAEQVPVLYARSVDLAGNQEYPFVETPVSSLKVFLPFVKR